MDENKILNLKKHQEQEKKNRDQKKHQDQEKHQEQHYIMINILNVNTEEQTPREETKSEDINQETMN